MTSATTFDSSTVVVPERPTGTLPIAGRPYEVRCPKLRVWIGVLEHQKRSKALQALEGQLERIYDRFIELNTSQVSEEEANQLLSQLGVMQKACEGAPNSLQLADIFLDFLGTCILDKKQAEQLVAAYHTDDGDVDMPHLVVAIEQLNVLFADWLYSQADFVGVEPPEMPERRPANREARRAAAGKQPVKVAAATRKRASGTRTR